jgi:N-6 DNA Methylase
MARHVSMLAYECLSVEGGLFPAEWFGKLAQSALPEMDAEHYRLPAGLQLRDEISRAWTISRTWWQRYAKVRDGRADEGPPAMKAAASFVSGWLREGLGFQTLTTSTNAAIVHGRAFQLTLTALQGRLPIVVAGWGESLDTPLDRLKDGRRRSPFGLMQEYLNAADRARWGIVANGRTLRLLRDNAALTRPTWVEVDLERLFAGDNHADFAALWLLLHETRFGLPDAEPADSWIERQRLAAMQDGTRARDKLSAGVTQALRDLGEGFLHHPENRELREQLRTGKVSEPAYFAQLLRLIYRLIFVVTVEERGLLHPSGTEGSLARSRYRDGYAILSLRDRAARTVHEDGHHDLWLRLQCVFEGLATGQPELALPAFGGLFAPSQCPNLDASSLGNASLLRALRALTWVPAGHGIARVNWRDMGSEEFGSVYESLLELVPQVRLGEPNPFRFLGDDSEGTEGNARRLTGSYYTPDSLVQVLLDSTLEPVIEQRLGAERDGSAAAETLLSLNVIDPACGSGHFLLGAARRLAAYLAQLRTDGTPSATEYRAALRQVITHCIYGTDKNALAIELARMALWLEAATPDAPLGFLDHHLRHGDSLLGLTDLAVLTDGIPEEAYAPLAGDDRATAQMLKRRNRQERTSLEKQRSTGPQFALLPPEPLDTEAFTLLEGMPDDTPERLEAKRARAETLASESAAKGVSLAANLYVAAFLSRKLGSGDTVPTTRDVLAALQGQKVPDPIQRAALEIAAAESFVHWKLVFPQAFARGGFDVVIGNPPWEKVKLAEKEFFASRAPEVAAAPNAAERRRRIQALSAAPRGSVERRLFDDYEGALRAAEGVGVWLHTPSRFALTGHGDVNLYAVFAETFLHLAGESGRAGLIVPTGIATDDSTKAFFGALTTQNRLASLFDFENKEGLFPTVHRSFKFCLLTFGRAERANFVFFASNVHQLLDSRRQFQLAAEDFAMLNPNTRTCPVFRSRRDADLTKKIYGNVPVLVDDRKKNNEGNPWGILFMTMFHMSNDSDLFRTEQDRKEEPIGGGTIHVSTSMDVPLVRLYEAKMTGLYDHRSGSYELRSGTRGNRVLPETTLAQHRDPSFEVTPYYWVAESEVIRRVPSAWTHRWFLGFNDVTTTVTERSFLATIVPWGGVGNNLPLIFPLAPSSVSLIIALCANLASLSFDYVARQKVGRLHLNFFIVKQLPVLDPVRVGRIIPFVVPRALELFYTAWDLKPLYDDVIAEDPAFDTRKDDERGAPYIWNPDRRAVLQAELDAMFADAYDLSLDDLRYILDPVEALGEEFPSETFRVLREREIREFGEYRTGRLVLEAWDRIVVPARRTQGLL